jgi:ribosomal protein L21E
VLQLSSLAGVKASYVNLNKKKEKRGKSADHRQTTLKTYKGGKALHVLMNDSLVARADWDTIIQGVTLAVHTETDVALAEVERGGRQRIPPKLPQQLPTRHGKSQSQRSFLSQSGTPGGCTRTSFSASMRRALVCTPSF